MDIVIENNRFYFNYLDKSFANLSIKNNSMKLELIKTVPAFRNMGLATNLLTEIIAFLKREKKCKFLFVNPLPLESSGLKFDSLIKFYIKYGFKKSNKADMHEPYLMVKEL